MKFSYSEVWNGTVELLRANAAIVIALAGVFIFLPALIMAHFIPSPVVEKPEDFVRMWSEYLTVNGHWLLLSRLISMVGVISLLLLFLDARGRSVGALIAAAILILPFYFLATFLSAALMLVGFLLLIVPGLYLLGRLAMVGPEVVAAERRNPITAISRSFELTKGKGWAVLGLLLLVAIPGVIIVGVIGVLLGILFLAVAGQDVGTLLTQIVQAIGGAALDTVMVALIAALYARLAAPASKSTVAGD